MNKKRIAILICVLLLICVCGLLIDISSGNGHRVCGFCGSRQEYAKVSYFVLGASWTAESHGHLKNSPFLVDFPDHLCEHSLSRFDLKTRGIWDSPLLHRPEDFFEPDMNASAIVRRYNEDEVFRRGIKQLLENGTLPRERLLELANFRCMDGGTCRMSKDDPGEAALLALIYDEEAERAEGE